MMGHDILSVANLVGPLDIRPPRTGVIPNVHAHTSLCDRFALSLIIFKLITCADKSHSTDLYSITAPS